MKKMRVTYVTGLIACAVLFSGCYQIKEKVTLNPDKSGKVSVDLVFPPEITGEITGTIDLTEGNKKSPDETLKDSVRGLLKESSGIEAWSDVAYNLTDDGKIHFSGTAYFKDINVFELQNMEVPIPVAVKKEDGRTTYEWQLNKENRGEAEKPTQMSEDEIKSAILKEKTDYQSSKAFTSVIFTDLSVEETVVLPGEVEQVTNLKKNAPNEVQLVIGGPKIMKAIEELMKDDEYLRSLVLVGKKPLDEMDDRMNEKVFGEKGPVRVVVKNSAMPLFDYNAEVAAARPKYEAIMAKLDSVPTALVTTADNGAFEKVEIAGVQMRLIADNDVGEQQSYILNLKGKLRNPVLSATGGVVEKAITTEGVNILSSEEFNRKINFPYLAKDKTSVKFDIQLLVPPTGTKGLREVSGVLECVTGDETKAKTVDLGITEFKNGAKGSFYNAEIKSLDGGNLNFSIGLKDAQIRSVTFYGEDGKEIKPASSSRSLMDEETSFYYSFDNLPPRGTIKISVLEDIKRLSIPFSVKNVSLFGAPLGEKASAESVNEPSVSIQDKNKMASFIGPEISQQKQIAIPALKEGIWLIVSPRYPDKQMKVLLKSVGEHRYRLTPDSFLYAGVYEQRKDTLVMVEPVSHDYNDFVWTIKDADHLELTNTEWSDYIGATLSRDISQ